MFSVSVCSIIVNFDHICITIVATLRITVDTIDHKVLITHLLPGFSIRGSTWTVNSLQLNVGTISVSFLPAYVITRFCSWFSALHIHYSTVILSLFLSHLLPLRWWHATFLLFLSVRSWLRHYSLSWCPKADLCLADSQLLQHCIFSCWTNVAYNSPKYGVPCIIMSDWNSKFVCCKLHKVTNFSFLIGIFNEIVWRKHYTDSLFATVSYLVRFNIPLHSKGPFTPSASTSVYVDGRRRPSTRVDGRRRASTPIWNTC